MALESRQQLVLPTIIFGSADIHRLLREMESFEEALTQAAAQEGGKPQLPPRTSRALDAIAGNNGFNLLLEADRKKIVAFLTNLLSSAPLIHISFAAEPTASFTVKVVAWLRTKIHPHTLLHVGLQPAITAGCVVRTTNRSFDFSLRHCFYDQRTKLIESLTEETKS